MTTFGELLSTAEGHLARAAAVLDHPEAGHQLRHPATVNELARLTAVLTRYGEHISNGFGLAPGDAEAVRSAAQNFTRHLHQARHILGTPEWREPNGPDLAWALRATSNTLGCGLDLLISHTTPGQTRFPAATATAITTTEASSALLHRLGQHAQTTAHLAEHSSPRAQQAARLLLNAAARTEGIHPNKALALEGMRLRHTGERIPPVPGENTTKLLHGIHISAQRLRNVDTMAGTNTWRYLATAAAVVCQLSSRVTGVITYRLRDLGHPDQAASLIPASHDIEVLSRKWRAIARTWSTLTETRITPGSAPATVDASDLIVRLGRLIHTDPAWTPRPKGLSKLTPPEQLVPDAAHASRLGLAVLRSIEACTALAAAHHTAVEDATKIVMMHRKRPRYAGHRVPTASRAIRTHYETAHQQGQKATTALGKALLAITPGHSPQAAETALILHRSTTPTSHESPAALAAQSFPTMTAQALQVLNSQAPSNPPPSLGQPRKPYRSR